MRSRRAALISAIALAAVLVAMLWSLRGPSPRPPSPRDFSADAAAAALREVLAGDTPHPIGSAANDAVRERIAAHLRNLGYVVQLQRAFACDAYNTCGNVVNIIARRAGDPARPSIVVAAHYDSVPAGPGASDDGLGIATILEIARVIRQEPFRNPPLLLVDDGEEAGLLGAEAFVGDPDLLRSTGFVINVEARGTNGPSALFETSRNNRWLVGHAVAAQPRPVTSSLFATIYDMLPNDTDLTVFKRLGLQGVNFGVIGNVAAYHTPLDNLQHLDPRSLQHHGMSALAVLRAAGNAELKSSDQNAVWFDVMSLFVVRWPERATIWIAIASTIALLVSTLLLRRERRVTVNDVMAGFLSCLLSAALAAAAGFAIAWLGRLRADGATWVSRPQPLIVAMWLAGVVVALAVYAAFSKRLGAEGLQLGTAFAWHAVGIALAATLPGASYLFVAPAVALTIWSLLRAFGAQFDGDVAVAAVIAAVVLFPLGLQLHDALGAPSLPILAVVVGLITTTFAACVPPVGRGPAIATVVAVLACIAISLASTPYGPSNPRRLNVVHVTDGAAAKWAVNAVTPELQRVAPFRRDASLFPWLRRSSWSTVLAPGAAMQPVRVSIDRDDRSASKRTVVWTVRSQRAAQRVALFFRTDATVESIFINGVPPPHSSRGRLPYAAGWRRAVVRGDTATIEAVMRGTKPIDFAAVDYSYDVPPAASALLAARNASDAVPSDDGDVTITIARGRTR